MSACSGSCHERMLWLACRQLSPPLKALLGTDNVWCDSRTEEGSQKFVLWAGCILERRSLLPRSLLREVPCVPATFIVAAFEFPDGNMYSQSAGLQQFRSSSEFSMSLSRLQPRAQTQPFSPEALTSFLHPHHVFDLAMLNSIVLSFQEAS